MGGITKRRVIALLAAGVLLAPEAFAQSGGDRPQNKKAIERWERMTPEQRRRAMDRLPPERRRRIEERQRRYENLPPEARERLRGRYEKFQKMPSGQQDRLRKLYRRFQNLPEARRAALGLEMRRLRDMPEKERQEAIESPEFRENHSPSERKMVKDLLATEPE